MKTIGQSQAIPWICAVLLFIISYPIWFWGMSPLVITVASLLLLILASGDMVRYKKGRQAGIICLFFQIIILGVTNILPTTNFNGILLVPISGLGFAPLFLCTVDFWKKCVDCFIKLLAVMLIFALLEHVMICFLDREIVNPYVSECPINKDRDYNIYLLNAYLLYSFQFFKRFFAFYDEPGVLGNIVMVLLYIQKFNLRKWYNIVLLISGVLSFSLTFYLAVAFYFILFGNKKSKIAFSVTVIALVVFFYNNEIVYDLVFGRLEFEDGQMAGYNRENADFDSWISSKNWWDYFLWGYQPRSAVEYAASWKWAFALYGIVPSIIYLFTIVYSRARYLNNKSDILRGLVLVVIIWIQRPFVYQYLYVFLVVIPFIYYNTTTKMDKANSVVKK